MSVIVMGVDIPEDCDSCWVPGQVCNLWLATDVGERHRGCPLRPLPEKHGRLIDADALKKTFRDAMDDCEGDFKRKEDAEEVRRWVELLCRDFDAQPTIVEPEGK